MIVYKDECFVLARPVAGGTSFAHWKEGATCVDGSYVDGDARNASGFSTASAAHDELMSSGQWDEGWRVHRLRTVYHLGGVEKGRKRR